MFILFATAAALLLHHQVDDVSHLPGQVPSVDETEASLEPLQKHPELCSPAVERALMQVLAKEAELDSLSRPLEEDGVIVEEPQHYNERLFGEGAPFREYIARNRARFDLRGQDAPGISYVADLIRYDAGFRAAEELVDNEGFEAVELLALFTPGFFAADPIWDTDEARRYHTSEQALGDLAPLGNGAALAYLTFGVLYQDDYWDAEEHDREAFVSQLLAKGFDGRFVAMGVDRALASPLLPPRKETGRVGRGAAGSLENLRGKVGFTKLHEEQLVTDLETLQAIKDLDSPDPTLNLKSRTITVGADMQPEITLPPRGHLKSWLPRMLQRVRNELYPGGSSNQMRHGKTLEERLTYWQSFLNQYGFIAGREQVLEELKAIMAGLDQHPLSKRIEALLALQAAGSITAEQAHELASLQQRRTEDRERLIISMASMLTQVGVGSHYELALSTLCADIPQAISQIAADHQQYLLRSAWTQLSQSKQPLIAGTVRDMLDDEALVPDWARGMLITGLETMRADLREPVLTEVLERGSSFDKCSALLNSDWLPAELLERTASDLLDEYRAPGTSSFLRGSISCGIMGGLFAQEDQAKSAALLKDIIQEGLWVEGEDASSWYSFLNNPYMAPDFTTWLHSILTADDISAFEEAGKLPKGLL